MHGNTANVIWQVSMVADADAEAIAVWPLNRNAVRRRVSTSEVALRRSRRVKVRGRTMDSHGEQSSRTLWEQGTLDLAGLPLPLLGDEEGGAWVAMHQLCELLGLEWTEQYEVLRTNPLWSGELVQAHVLSAQGEEEALCLPLLQVRGWLFALNTGDVKAELRGPLVGYQRAITEALDARKQLKKRQLAQHLRDLDALYAQAMHHVEEIQLMREECLAAAEVWYGDAFDSETSLGNTPKGSTDE